MFGKLLLTAAVAMAVVPAISAVPQRRSLIGGRYYFVDNTVLRTHSQALAYCQSQNAELARVNKTVYDVMRVSIPTNGYYWIDGRDKADVSRFESDTSCTAGQLDFKGIPDANIKIGATSCLALLKGANAAATSISSVACTSQFRGVICALPLDGCDIQTTTSIITSRTR